MSDDESRVFEEFDSPLHKMRFDNKHCFICGIDLTESVHTAEHIIPGWVQRKFNLWNQRLTLFNKTQIPYRQLKIPCCARCNGEGLSRIENTMKRAVEGGYESVRAVDEFVIFQWTAKIFYGLLYKDLSLLWDRSIPEIGTIVEKENLTEIRNTHALLQSIYRPIEISGDRLFTVIVLNLHKVEESEFLLADNYHMMTIGLRLGEVGIIVALQDRGLNHDSFRRYETDLEGRKAHPIQFDELFAKVTYNCTRLQGVPYHLWSFSKDTDEVRLRNFQGIGTLDPWNQKDYSVMLSIHFEKWGYGLEDIYAPPNRTVSHMRSPTGELLLLDKDGEEMGTLDP